MFGTSVLVKGLLIQAIIEWTIGIRGIMLTLNLKKKIGKNILSEKKNVYCDWIRENDWDVMIILIFGLLQHYTPF
jgi:hypothetical protein